MGTLVSPFPPSASLLAPFNITVSKFPLSFYCDFFPKIKQHRGSWGSPGTNNVTGASLDQKCCSEARARSSHREEEEDGAQLSPCSAPALIKALLWGWENKPQQRGCFVESSFFQHSDQNIPGWVVQGGCIASHSATPALGSRSMNTSVQVQVRNNLPPAGRWAKNSFL